MKIADMVISAILRRGIVYDSKNTDISVNVPNGPEVIKVNIKAEHMKISIEKGDIDG